MKTFHVKRTDLAGLALAFVSAAGTATAAEGFRLRASPAGALGAEIGAPLQPGLNLNLTLSHTDVRGIADESGSQLQTAPRDIPLPTGTPTGGAIPNGTFHLLLPAGAVNLKQSQTQLNIVANYLPAFDFAGGRLLLRANLPIVRIDRDFSITSGAPAISPPPASPPLPPAAVGAVNAVASAVNAQVQASLAATAAVQNRGISGIGDLELNGAWVSEVGRLRLLAGAGVHLPTGAYNASRGPNPGFGDFRTLQFGVASVYALENGLRLGGRASWGTNSTNRKTGYRTGDFAVFEAAARKDWMQFGVGLNFLALRQLEDDRQAGFDVPNMRLRSYSAGPLVTWRLSRDMAITAQHTRIFNGRSTQLSQTTFVRMDMAMH